MEREFAYQFPRWSLMVGLILGPLMILAGVAGVGRSLGGRHTFYPANHLPIRTSFRLRR